MDLRRFTYGNWTITFAICLHNYIHRNLWCIDLSQATQVTWVLYSLISLLPNWSYLDEAIFVKWCVLHLHSSIWLLERAVRLERSRSFVESIRAVKSHWRDLKTLLHLSLGVDHRWAQGFKTIASLCKFSSSWWHSGWPWREWNMETATFMHLLFCGRGLLLF